MEGPYGYRAQYTFFAWPLNVWHPTGFYPFHALSPYSCAQIGLTGEVTPRDASLLLSRGIMRKALRNVVSFILNEVAALHRSLTLPVVPWFSACRHVYVFHWTPPPPTLVCSSSWSSRVLESPGRPRSALLQVLLAMIPFSVHVPLAVASHQGPNT